MRPATKTVDDCNTKIENQTSENRGQVQIEGREMTAGNLEAGQVGVALTQDRSRG
jgi:hypothetical protein